MGRRTIDVIYLTTSLCTASMKAVLLFFVISLLVSCQRRPMSAATNDEYEKFLFPVNIFPTLEYIFQTLFGKYRDDDRVRKRSKRFGFYSLLLLSVYALAVVSAELRKQSGALFNKCRNGENSLSCLGELPGIVEKDPLSLVEESNVSSKSLPSFFYHLNGCAPIGLVTAYPAHLNFYFEEAKYTDNDDGLMKYEWARYVSFKSFPSDSPVMPSRLAASGFYYIGPDDAVKCFSCQVVYSGWRNGDCPSTTHKQLSPSCSFLDESVTIHDPPSTENACAYNAHDNHNSRETVTATKQQSSHNRSYVEDCIKHPQYKEFNVRLSSFSKWYNGDVQDPYVLAEAGFFYAGFGDCVRCHCCGIGLRNWEYGEGPWEEHARWSADCSFLKQNRSLEFIRRCQEIPDNDQASGGACAASKLQQKEKEYFEEKKPADEKQNEKVLLENSKASDEIFKGQCSPEEPKAQLLEMGFEHKLVTEAVDVYMQRQDDAMPTCLDLLDIITSIEKSRETSPTRLDPKSENKPEGKRQADTTFVEKISEKWGSISSPDNALSIDGLQEENRRLKNQLVCKICMDRDACMVLIPCGHMISCEACSPALRKCAICRKIVRDRVKAYLS